MLRHFDSEKEAYKEMCRIVRRYYANPSYYGATSSLAELNQIIDGMEESE